MGWAAHGSHFMITGIDEKVLRNIIAKVTNEKRRLEQAIPIQYMRLSEILDKNIYSIKLASGDIHYFDIDEVSKLSKLLPWYLHSYVELPFVFKYVKLLWGAVFELVNNVRWNGRAISVILGDSYTKTRTEISYSEMKILLKEFRSLVFIRIGSSF